MPGKNKIGAAFSRWQTAAADAAKIKINSQNLPGFFGSLLLNGENSWMSRKQPAK